MFLAIAVAALASVAMAQAPVQPEPKAPADDLSGPPFVTAVTWAIADGKTGQFLYGHDPDKPMLIASTTKIMTAFIVLKLAEKDPKVLEQVVTISKFADDTTGSTADVREGEKLVLSELLYGLLLPSGNDAANAIAEHFNDRYQPLGPDDSNGELKLPASSRSNFIAEMNRTAKRLGMKNTVYRSPVGDGLEKEKKTSTARDLLILAHAAMQMPLFRQYVSTIAYSGNAIKPDGTPRVAQWKNTNALLQTEGFDGIKTGTTTAAGSCLVSSCHRGEDHLLAVVLGAANNPARFVDTQNLLRWAWLQRKTGK